MSSKFAVNQPTPLQIHENEQRFERRNLESREKICRLQYGPQNENCLMPDNSVDLIKIATGTSESQNLRTARGLASIPEMSPCASYYRQANLLESDAIYTNNHGQPNNIKNTQPQSQHQKFDKLHEECSYIEDMHPNPQSNCVCNNFLSVNKPNNELGENMLMLQRKCDELKKNIMRHQLGRGHGYTTERFPEFCCRQEAMGDHKEKSSDVLDKGNLSVLAKQLNQILFQSNTCKKCNHLPTDLKGTLKGIKNLIDLIHEHSKESTTLTPLSCWVPKSKYRQWEHDLKTVASTAKLSRIDVGVQSGDCSLTVDHETKTASSTDVKISTSDLVQSRSQATSQLSVQLVDKAEEANIFSKTRTRSSCQASYQKDKETSPELIEEFSTPVPVKYSKYSSNSTLKNAGLSTPKPSVAQVVTDLTSFAEQQTPQCQKADIKSSTSGLVQRRSQATGHLPTQLVDKSEEAKVFSKTLRCGSSKSSYQKDEETSPQLIEELITVTSEAPVKFSSSSMLKNAILSTPKPSVAQVLEDIATLEEHQTPQCEKTDIKISTSNLVQLRSQATGYLPVQLIDKSEDAKAKTRTCGSCKSSYQKDEETSPDLTEEFWMPLEKQQSQQWDKTELEDESELVVEVYEEVGKDFNITGTVTKSGTVEVITKSLESVIETTLTYTKSGNVNISTEVITFKEDPKELKIAVSSTSHRNASLPQLLAKSSLMSKESSTTCYPADTSSDEVPYSMVTTTKISFGGECTSFTMENQLSDSEENEAVLKDTEDTKLQLDDAELPVIPETDEISELQTVEYAEHLPVKEEEEEELLISASKNLPDNSEPFQGKYQEANDFESDAEEPQLDEEILDTIGPETKDTLPALPQKSVKDVSESYEIEIAVDKIIEHVEETIEIKEEIENTLDGLVRYEGESDKPEIQIVEHKTAEDINETIETKEDITKKTERILESDSESAKSETKILEDKNALNIEDMIETKKDTHKDDSDALNEAVELKAILTAFESAIKCTSSTIKTYEASLVTSLPATDKTEPKITIEMEQEEEPETPKLLSIAAMPSMDALIDQLLLETKTQIIPAAHTTNELKTQSHVSVDEQPFDVEDLRKGHLRKKVEEALSKANSEVMDALRQANKNVTEALEKVHSNVASALTLAVKIRALSADKQTVVEKGIIQPPTMSKSDFEVTQPPANFGGSMQQQEDVAEVTQQPEAVGEEETDESSYYVDDEKWQERGKSPSTGQGYWGGLYSEEKLKDIPRIPIFAAPAGRPPKDDCLCHDVCGRLYRQHKEVINNVPSLKNLTVQKPTEELKQNEAAVVVADRGALQKVTSAPTVSVRTTVPQGFEVTQPPQNVAEVAQKPEAVDEQTQEKQIDESVYYVDDEEWQGRGKSPSTGQGYWGGLYSEEKLRDIPRIPIFVAPAGRPVKDDCLCHDVCGRLYRQHKEVINDVPSLKKLVVQEPTKTKILGEIQDTSPEERVPEVKQTKAAVVVADRLADETELASITLEEGEPVDSVLISSIPDKKLDDLASLTLPTKETIAKSTICEEMSEEIPVPTLSTKETAPVSLSVEDILKNLPLATPPTKETLPISRILEDIPEKTPPSTSLVSIIVKDIISEDIPRSSLSIKEIPEATPPSIVLVETLEETPVLTLSTEEIAPVSLSVKDILENLPLPTVPAKEAPPISSILEKLLEETPLLASCTEETAPVSSMAKDMSDKMRSSNLLIEEVQVSTISTEEVPLLTLATTEMGPASIMVEEMSEETPLLTPFVEETASVSIIIKDMSKKISPLTFPAEETVLETVYTEETPSPTISTKETVPMDLIIKEIPLKTVSTEETAPISVTVEDTSKEMPLLTLSIEEIPITSEETPPPSTCPTEKTATPSSSRKRSRKSQESHRSHKSKTAKPPAKIEVLRPAKSSRRSRGAKKLQESDQPQDLPQQEIQVAEKTECKDVCRPAATVEEVSRRRRSKSSSDKKEESRSSRRSSRKSSLKVTIAEPKEGKSKSLEQVPYLSVAELGLVETNEVNRKLAEIKCDCKRYDCKMCSPQKLRPKEERRKRDRLLPETPQDSPISLPKLRKSDADRKDQTQSTESPKAHAKSVGSKHPSDCLCANKSSTAAKPYHLEGCDCLSTPNTKIRFPGVECLYKKPCAKVNAPDGLDTKTSTIISNVLSTSQAPTESASTKLSIIEIPTDTQILSTTGTSHPGDCDCFNCLLTKSSATTSTKHTKTGIHSDICRCCECSAKIRQTDQEQQTNDGELEKTLLGLDNQFQQQMKEIANFEEMVKTTGSVCHQAQMKAATGSPLEKSFVAIQSSSFHLTLSGLKVALAALQSKSNTQDQMVEAMTRELNLLTNRDDDQIHKRENEDNKDTVPYSKTQAKDPGKDQSSTTHTSSISNHSSTQDDGLQNGTLQPSHSCTRPDKSINPFLSEASTSAKRSSKESSICSASVLEDDVASEAAFIIVPSNLKKSHQVQCQLVSNATGAISECTGVLHTIWPNSSRPQRKVENTVSQLPHLKVTERHVTQFPRQCIPCRKLPSVRNHSTKYQKPPPFKPIARCPKPCICDARPKPYSSREPIMYNQPNAPCPKYKTCTNPKISKQQSLSNKRIIHPPCPCPTIINKIQHWSCDQPKKGTIFQRSKANNQPSSSQPKTYVKPFSVDAKQRFTTIPNRKNTRGFPTCFGLQSAKESNGLLLSGALKKRFITGKGSQSSKHGCSFPFPHPCFNTSYPNKYYKLL